MPPSQTPTHHEHRGCKFYGGGLGKLIKNIVAESSCVQERVKKNQESSILTRIPEKRYEELPAATADGKC